MNVQRDWNLLTVEELTNTPGSESPSPTTEWVDRCSTDASA